MSKAAVVKELLASTPRVFEASYKDLVRKKPSLLTLCIVQNYLSGDKVTEVVFQDKDQLEDSELIFHMGLRSGKTRIASELMKAYTEHLIYVKMDEGFRVFAERWLKENLVFQRVPVSELL